MCLSYKNIVIPQPVAPAMVEIAIKGLGADF